MTRASLTQQVEAPTRQQLELAYRQLRQPNHWPKTLDAALAEPTFATCLLAMARNLGRARWTGHTAAPGLPRGPVPADPGDPTATPHPGPSLITSRWSARRGVDLKRLAANDLDD
jgi:hypothetical protein